MNQAAKDLQEGNYVAFEEFTNYEDSDYDSSDVDESSPHPIADKVSIPVDKDGKPIQPGPVPKPPPKADKNHDVKPKESFAVKDKQLN